MAYSPLGRGFLTGKIRSTEQLDSTDLRSSHPRFTGENFQRNLRLLDEAEAVAAEVGATPAQVERLTNLPPAAGDHHTEAQMKMIEH